MDESEVIGILTGALDLSTIGVVVKYHVYAGGKVDCRTALSLDPRRGNGTDTFITMYSGGELGIDRRHFALQLDDAVASSLLARCRETTWMTESVSSTRVQTRNRPR